MNTTMTAKRALFTAAASAAIAIALPAFAQFTGPASGSVATTVRDVLERGRDDQMVVLEGNIVSQVKHDEYRFQDATGTIIVEIDDKIFRGQRVDVNTRVRIEGEVEKEYIKPNEVDVKRLTIIR